MQRVAVYGILLRDAHETAVLDGYRLAFGAAFAGGSVFATVVEAPGESVVVGVVETTAEGVHHYDAIEGHRVDDPTRGFYRRTYVVLDDGDAGIGAWVYVMNDPVAQAPETFLVQRMILEYVRLGIPMGQLVAAAMTR